MATLIIIYAALAGIYCAGVLLINLPELRLKAKLRRGGRYWAKNLVKLNPSLVFQASESDEKDCVLQKLVSLRAEGMLVCSVVDDGDDVVIHGFEIESGDDPYMLGGGYNIVEWTERIETSLPASEVFKLVPYNMWDGSLDHDPEEKNDLF